MKYLFSGLIFILLLGCQDQRKDIFSIAIEKEDLPEIKSTILEGYDAYDSIFFSGTQNLNFRNFVLNEIDSLDLYYDNIVSGFSIKHFYLPHNNIEFALVRGTDGAFYYIGLTDMLFYERELLRNRYCQNGYMLNCDSFNIEILKHEKSGEEFVLNKILDKDPFFKIASENQTNEYYYAPRIDRMTDLIFHIYHSFKLSHYSEPLFNEVLELEEELKALYGGVVDNDVIKKIMNKYDKLTYYYLDKRAVFFKQKHKGIFLFYIEYSDGNYEVTKEFIPASTVILQ